MTKISRLTPYRGSSSGVSGFGSGVCHQEFREISDVNFILRRFQATGVLPNVRGMVSLPCESFLYSDFSDLNNTLNLSKNEHDLVTQALYPVEVPVEDSSDSVQKEGSVNSPTVEGGVKGESPVAGA